MGGKIKEEDKDNQKDKVKIWIRFAEIVSLILVNFIWLVVILIWFFQYLDNEIGRAVMSNY
jgi:hypothetical protein